VSTYLPFAAAASDGGRILEKCLRNFELMPEAIRRQLPALVLTIMEIRAWKCVTHTVTLALGNWVWIFDVHAYVRIMRDVWV
jgi:hypothetical protein